MLLRRLGEHGAQAFLFGAETRERFARALVALASGEGHTRVVFGVREDFFGRLASVPSFRDIYSRQVEVVTTPDRPALARTLMAPARVFGYVFEEEELVTTMIDAVAETPAALALLQFCADRLWEQRDRKWKRLTRDAYRAVGGVEGALAQHADKVLADAYPDRMRHQGQSAIEAMLAASRLGQKNGKGFYAWKPEKKGPPSKQSDPEARSLVAACSEASKSSSDSPRDPVTSSNPTRPLPTPGTVAATACCSHSSSAARLTSSANPWYSWVVEPVYWFIS